MKTFSQSSKMTKTKSSLSPLLIFLIFLSEIIRCVLAGRQGAMANRFLLRVLFFGKDDEDKK